MTAKPSLPCRTAIVGGMKRPASTLLLAVGLGALLSSTVLAQDATEPGPSDLEVALSYAPEGTTIAGFTDWGAIKQARGLEILTSDVPEDMRINALGTIAREEALFASFGASSFRDHATRWGWDTTRSRLERGLLRRRGARRGPALPRRS